jgi:serine/threonine protein kinase
MIYQINDNHRGFNDFILHIRDFFKNSSDSIHKARNEIKVIPYKDMELVVKSFKVPHLINKIIYSFFRDSKAKKSYDNSVKVGDFAPKPIAYIEFKRFGLLHDSYFISENFHYDFTIREPLLDKDFTDKEEVFKQFARFTYALHEEGIYHLDYSPGNILIKQEGSNFEFKIVDINRMQFKTMDLNDRLKNFSKLWAKNEDMKIIVKEYAKLINEDENRCIEKAIYFSQKNKDFKNFKKRLKGKEVVD